MAYRDPEVQRQRDRERFRRRTAERRARGLCPRCGDRPPATDRTVCEPCADKRNRTGRARDARLRAEGKPRRDPEKARAAGRERDRRQRARRQAQGLCAKCGREPATPARRLCEWNAAARRRYAERRAAGRCTDCGEPSQGASRCDACARRSCERSDHFRGMPFWPPGFAVFLRETDECLATFDDEMEAVAWLAFEKLDRDRIEIVANRSPLATLAGWE